MKSIKRIFLRRSPSLAAAAYEVDGDDFKLSVAVGSSYIRLHSDISEPVPSRKFKVALLVNELENFLYHVKENKAGNNKVSLNPASSPHTGSCAWMYEAVPSAEYDDCWCYFEVASCDQKLRVYASEKNITLLKKLLSFLKSLRKELHV